MSDPRSISDVGARAAGVPAARSRPRRAILRGTLMGSVGVLFLLPASCAWAQEPAQDEPAPRAERIQPPDRAEEPGTPVAWVERGFRDDGDPPVVNVHGRGEVEVDPDRAHVSFAVETESESAREAAEENAQRMTGVLDAVRSAGEDLPGFRVETSGYSLVPRYRTPRETSIREIAGYTARNHVVVTVDDVDQVGRLMDAALQNGANRMAGLHFSIQDPEPHREAALQEAVRKARTEARIMAEALGMRLGPPIQVDGGAEIPGPRSRVDGMTVAFMAEEAMAAPTPVEAGTQTISANVSIRFRLEPGR